MTKRFSEIQFTQLINEISGKREELNQDQAEIQNGVIRDSLFKKLCGKEHTLIRSYLLKFELAVELEDGEVFIPSLVSKTNKVNREL